MKVLHSHQYPHHLQQRRGFTLLEVVLYSAIVSLIVFSITTSLVILLQTREKSQTLLNLKEEGSHVLQTIVRSIENARGINSPAAGGSAATLSLTMTNGAANPTVFQQSGGAMMISEGSGGNVSLTSSKMIISNLTFTNVSAAGTPGIIRVQFTITHHNPNSQYEYAASETFYSSASLR